MRLAWADGLVTIREGQPLEAFFPQPEIGPPPAEPEPDTSLVHWTTLGPVYPRHIAKVGLRCRWSGMHFEVESLGKFPKMVDYVVPPGVKTWPGRGWLGRGASREVNQRRDRRRAPLPEHERVVVDILN